MPLFFEQLVEMSDFAKDHPTLSSEEALDSLGKASNWWHQFMYTQASKASRFDQETFNSTVVSKLFWILFLFVPAIGYLAKAAILAKTLFLPGAFVFWIL
ncbi:MAG: hypothetical protein U5L96_03325 [Owenweeksia sp.]|nr:hypothetical protein [Owenweeksia sp.]